MIALILGICCVELLFDPPMFEEVLNKVMSGFKRKSHRNLMHFLWIQIWLWFWLAGNISGCAPLFSVAWMNPLLKVE